jgi:hypothetical protein
MSGVCTTITLKTGSVPAAITDGIDEDETAANVMIMMLH